MCTPEFVPYVRGADAGTKTCTPDKINHSFLEMHLAGGEGGGGGLLIKNTSPAVL